MLFIITMIPFNDTLRKCTAGYKLCKLQEKINRLISMDDIKLFAKKKEKRKRTGNSNTSSENMQSGYRNGIWHRKMKSNKRRLTDGMELTNQSKIRTLGEKETYIYLGILVADTITQVETKEKIKKEYLNEN